MTLSEIQQRIEQAAKRAGRDLQDVRVLAVTKDQSVERVQNFLNDVEQAKFKLWGLGESYIEEFTAKQEALKKSDIGWHFIGRLQSRKIAQLCQMSKCLQSVSRTKELQAISEFSKAQNKKVEFFLQVNVSTEDSKNGVLPNELPILLEEVERLSLHSQLLGLMTIAAPLEEVGESVLRSQFATLRDLGDQYLPRGFLNMGMSSDFEIAIEEGSNVVRLGTVLLGSRHKVKSLVTV